MGIESIVNVVETNCAEYCNEYLKIGWVLLTTATAENEIIYSVGWDKCKGDILYPSMKENEFKSKLFLRLLEEHDDIRRKKES